MRDDLPVGSPVITATGAPFRPADRGAYPWEHEHDR